MKIVCGGEQVGQLIITSSIQCFSREVVTEILIINRDAIFSSPRTSVETTSYKIKINSNSK